MASRIVRKSNSVILLGAPTSAAASMAGTEKAPERLRTAALASRLREASFEVSDLGDSPIIPFETDDENPRARNLRHVLRALESLRPLVEQAVRTGGLPLVLGGDSSIALAVLGALRRHYRALSLFYMSGNAGLNIPATSSSGFIEDMIVAHVTGQGAAELVRFWGDPPPVREPEIALFGVDRLDAPGAEWLNRSPMRCYLAEDLRQKAPAESAQLALERIHGHQHEFLLHLDANVIVRSETADVDGSSDSGGLDVAYVREVLAHLVKQPHLAAIEVTSYNPDRDADGQIAEALVTLLTEALRSRREVAASGESAAGAASPGQTSVPEAPLAATSVQASAASTASAQDSEGALSATRPPVDDATDEDETSASTPA